MPRRLSLEDRIRALAKEDKATQNRNYNFKVHGKRLVVSCRDVGVAQTAAALMSLGGSYCWSPAFFVRRWVCLSAYAAASSLYDYGIFFAPRVIVL